MEFVKDLKWKKGMDVASLVSSLGKVGFQAIHLERAKETIIKMKKDVSIFDEKQ